MRALPLLLCLALGACAGVSLPGAEAPPPAPQASAAPPPAEPPPPAAAPSRPSRSSGRNVAAGGGGARGGATTAASRAEPAEPVDPGADPLTQARADCWMKVEANRSMRSIDQRSAFVDKCVADRMKGAN
jgi:hypothetical protein